MAIFTPSPLALIFFGFFSVLTPSVPQVTLPDYDHLRKKREKAYNDFKQRIANYEKVYQKVDEDNLSWVKLINNGQKVVINRIHGFLPMKMVQFLTNIHAFPHSFYLSRHGQSEYNRYLKIGGDSGLTELGEQYALDLGKFAEEKICVDQETGQPRAARLWTSSLVRTVQTARHIPHPTVAHPETGTREWIQMDHRIYRSLDELYAGVRRAPTAARGRDFDPPGSSDLT